MKFRRPAAVGLAVGALLTLAPAAATAAPKPKPAPIIAPGNDVPTRTGGTPHGCTLKSHKPEKIGGERSNDGRVIIEAYCDAKVTPIRPVGIGSKMERCRHPAMGFHGCASRVLISSGRKFVDRGHDHALDSEVTFHLTPPVGYQYFLSGTITWNVPRVVPYQPQRILTSFSSSAVLRGTDYDVIGTAP